MLNGNKQIYFPNIVLMTIYNYDYIFGEHLSFAYQHRYDFLLIELLASNNLDGKYLTNCFITSGTTVVKSCNLFFERLT